MIVSCMVRRWGEGKRRYLVPLVLRHTSVVVLRRDILAIVTNYHDLPIAIVRMLGEVRRATRFVVDLVF